jgi:hypothetical protein
VVLTKYPCYLWNPEVKTFVLMCHMIELLRLWKKLGYLCLFINSQKIYFMMKWSSSEGASFHQISWKSETKNFWGQKTPKGLAFKFFWVCQKKKNLFNKSCRYLKTDGIKWLYFFDILKVKIKKVYTIPFNMW